MRTGSRAFEAFFSVLEPVAGSAGFEDRDPVGEPVAAEHFGPVFKGQVGGDDEAGAFVGAAVRVARRRAARQGPVQLLPTAVHRRRGARALRKADASGESAAGANCAGHQLNALAAKEERRHHRRMKHRLSRSLALALAVLGLFACNRADNDPAAKLEADAAPADNDPADKLKAATKQENAEAQFKLGWMYARGDGVPKDAAEAEKCFRKAADQGDAIAKSNLSWMYARGDGVPQDDAEAEKWFRKAADQVDAKEQYNLGVMYASGEGVPVKNDVVAVKWFRKAAERGHAEAQFNLGLWYDWGERVPQDDAEAVKWYRKAADQGYANAQNNLGEKYDYGKGVPQDAVEAVKWYRKAADQGHANAQANLALMYSQGKGVPEDVVRAYMYFNLAAADERAFTTNAAEKREFTAKRMTPAQIAEAQRMSREWKPTVPKK
jgi:TPR repeat protein